MLDKSMSDVDPRRGACLSTDEGLEELVFKELGRGMAGVSSHLRASRVKYGMGSRKHLALNRWKRARKGLLQKERWDSCRES